MSNGWIDRAACSSVDTGVFFPDVRRGPGRRSRDRMEAPAKLVCEACPVKDPCLEYALRYALNDGVYGGMGEVERRQERRRRRALRAFSARKR
jgi:WhiB family redox-sensing transcriptional regulator